MKGSRLTRAESTSERSPVAQREMVDVPDNLRGLLPRLGTLAGEAEGGIQRLEPLLPNSPDALDDETARQAMSLIPDFHMGDAESREAVAASARSAAASAGAFFATGTAAALSTALGATAEVGLWDHLPRRDMRLTIPLNRHSGPPL